MKKKNVWIARSVMPVILLFLSLSRSTVANAEPPAPVPAQVKIDNFSFGPQTLTIPVGTTVTWTNRDDIPHTIVSTDGVFKSKVRDTDETFSFTFTKAGTYTYFCSVHPKMTGKIVVQWVRTSMREPMKASGYLLLGFVEGRQHCTRGTEQAC